MQYKSDNICRKEDLRIYKNRSSRLSYLDNER